VEFLDSFGSSPVLEGLVLPGLEFEAIESLQQESTHSPLSTEKIQETLPDWADVARCTSTSPDADWKNLATTLVADQGHLNPISTMLSQREERFGYGEQDNELDLWLGFRGVCPSVPHHWFPIIGSYGIINFPKESILMYSRLVSTTMHGRRLFRTETGTIGIGPDDIQEGDLIVIFFGARTPFIIRRNERADRFTLIGDCYVHGLMNGEGLRMSLRQRQYVII
jgi:hypothetical protein